MKKIFISILLILAIMLSVVFGTAINVGAINTEESVGTETTHMSNGFIYQVYSESAMITGYTGTSKSVTIPAKLDGYPVRYVGDNTPNTGEGFPLTGIENITSVTIGNNVTVESSKVIDSKIADNCKIGPFAHIRPNCDIAQNCKVGSFAEVKNVQVGSSTKIPHLIYAGDATIGENVEIACGVITANMNTKWQKNRTQIQDGAFIGCNSTLIAPVTVGKKAVVGAGSVLTEDVPDNALAVERGTQVIKENYTK